MKKNVLWLLALLPLAFVVWFFALQHDDVPLRLLPYYGPKRAIKKNDTDYHRIGEFNFINQYGKPTNNATVKDKIFVTEFFFTTCKTICPIMNRNMEKVYETFANEPDFLILSHTVDPETDSVPQLANYAAAHGVNNEKWLFLTGSKKDLYEMARKSYLLNAEEGDGGEEDFIHTQNFALIDKEGHLRGFYDGTDNQEMERLLKDIKILLKEYAYRKKK